LDPFSFSIFVSGYTAFDDIDEASVLIAASHRRITDLVPSKTFVLP
jgi:hypothetical protein